MKLKKKRGLQYLLITIPFILFTFAFSYIPLFGWSFSFYQYKVALGLSGSKFVGLEHYARLLTDPQIRRTLRNTLVQSGLSLLFSPVPMFVAIGMNEIRNMRVKKFVQTVTTLPHFISWIVLFGLSYVFFASDGALNQILEIIGLKKFQFGLLGEKSLTWGVQQGLGMWKGVGWSAIIYMAAIAGIDTEMYDAAKVDGANKLQLIRHITLPGILPTYVVLFLLSVGNVLNTGFDQYFMFWNPMVAERIENLDYLIYRTAFGDTINYSYSITIGIVKSLIGVALMFVVNALSKRIRGNTIV